MDTHSAFLNIEEFYRRVYWSVPTATTVCTDSYTLSYSGVRWLASANQFWFHLPLDAQAVYLRLAERFFKKKYSADYTVNIAEPLMPGAGVWLRDLGFRESLVSPMLIMDGLPDALPPNPHITIRRAFAKDQSALLQLMYEVFFIGPEIGRCVVQAAHFASNAPMQHYIAWYDGQPAACGTLSLGHGFAGLWSVGTLRPFRKHGVATALVGYILNAAGSLGCAQSVLLASPMGRPLYERMGFCYGGDAVQYSSTP